MTGKAVNSAGWRNVLGDGITCDSYTSAWILSIMGVLGLLE